MKGAPITHTPAEDTIQMIPVDAIQVLHPRARSHRFPQDKLTEHIAVHGLKRPIVVRPTPNGCGYQLLAGERRLAAFRARDSPTIPAYVRHWSDEELQAFGVFPPSGDGVDVAINRPVTLHTALEQLMRRALANAPDDLVKGYLMSEYPEVVPVPSEITLIPVNAIRVLNPRERLRWKHRQLIDSIATHGLKKPITVRPTAEGDGYELACGQGRLEAFQYLEYPMIPAFVRALSDEDLHTISLVENYAYHRPSSMELVRRLGTMRDDGYTATQIAKKVNLSKHYVTQLLHLLDHGEERLICALEQQRLSLASAVLIAYNPDGDIQVALAQACEDGKVTKKDLQRALRIADLRRAFGPKNVIGGRKRNPITRDSVIETIRKETAREQQAFRRVELGEKYLAFCRQSLGEVLQHAEFVDLLRQEGLHTIPETVGELILGMISTSAPAQANTEMRSTHG